MAYNAKTAMRTTSSLLKILMSNYKDNPPLKELSHDDCKNALRLSYKIEIDEDDNTDEDYTLQTKILKDYRNDNFIKNISNIIINVIKKDEKQSQSVYNTDINRLTYFIKKTLDHWIVDKAGINFNKLVIEPILNTIISLINEYYNYLIKYNKSLCDKLEEYKIKNNKRKTDKIHEIMELNNLDIITSNNIIKECKTTKYIKTISKNVSPHLQFIKDDNKDNKDNKDNQDSDDDDDIIIESFNKLDNNKLFDFYKKCVDNGIIKNVD
jgi:hypothetical protein